MIKTRARKFGALVVGLALVAGACGGSDDAAEEPAEEPAAEEAAEEPAEEPAAEAAGDGVLRLGGSQDLSSELRLEMASLHLAPRLLRLALDRRELLAALELLHLSDGILHLQRVCVGTRGAVILEGEENETERRRGRTSDESGEGNDGTRKRREQGALPDFSGRTREARTMTTRRRIGRAIAVGRGREAGGAGCGASGGAGRPARVPAVPNAPSRERPSKGRAQTAFKSLRAIVSRERRDAETCVL